MDDYMDNGNVTDIVRSNEYYASLLQDLDVITRPKDNKPFVLPESSVWHRLKLTSARIEDDHGKKDSSFSLEREILRIQASTEADFRHTKSPRKCNLLTEHTMTAKERTIDEKYLAPYRGNPTKFAQLLERIDAKKRTDRRAHHALLAAQASVKMEQAPILPLFRNISERRRPTFDETEAPDHFDSSDFGASEKRHAGRIVSASGKHGSSKHNPTETPASRYMRQAGWLRIVAACARMTLSIEALQDMRNTRAQDVAKWDAAIKLQRFWRACFLRLIVREAAAVGTGFDSQWTMSSKHSSKLRRITRSEKMSVSASIPEDDSELQMLLQSRQRMAQSRAREQACAMILTFLRDLDKLFRNRVMKFIRCVKVLQTKMRVHFAVTRARMQLLSLWMERSLPALCLHAKIVVAGRGLDLRNLTANDRENIRQMELQYAEYRYVPPPPASASAGRDVPGECSNSSSAQPDPLSAGGPGKGRNGVSSGPSGMSLVRQMYTVQFHAFLRVHHELIVSSNFLTEFAPIVQASPQQPLILNTPAHAATQARQSMAQTIASLRYTALSGLVVRNRRAYMLKANKKTAAEFKKFVLTVEDARALIRDGRDSLCEHLLETGLKEAISAGMRVRQLMGGRRLGLGLGIPTASGGNSNVDSRRASTTATAANTNTCSAEGSGCLQRERSFRGTGALQREKSFKGPGGGSLQKESSFRGTGKSEKVRTNMNSSVSSENSTNLQREGSFRGTGKSEKVRTVVANRGATSDTSGSLQKEGSFRGTGRSEKVRSATGTSTSAAKSRSKAKNMAVTATASSVPTALLLSRMPLPPVFLLLRSVTAEDMALLFFDVADQTRRLCASAMEKGRRRASVGGGRLSTVSSRNAGPHRATTATTAPNVDGSSSVQHTVPSAHHATQLHQPHAPPHTSHVHRLSSHHPPPPQTLTASGHLHSGGTHTPHKAPHTPHAPQQGAAKASPMLRRIS